MPEDPNEPTLTVEQLRDRLNEAIADGLGANPVYIDRITNGIPWAQRVTGTDQFEEGTFWLFPGKIESPLWLAQHPNPFEEAQIPHCPIL